MSTTASTLKATDSSETTNSDGQLVRLKEGHEWHRMLIDRKRLNWISYLLKTTGSIFVTRSPTGGKKKKNVNFIKRFCYGYIRAMFSYSISSSWPPLLSLVCLCFPASSLESESEMTLPLTWLPVSISIRTTPDSHNTHTHARKDSLFRSLTCSQWQTDPANCILFFDSQDGSPFHCCH